MFLGGNNLICRPSRRFECVKVKLYQCFDFVFIMIGVRCNIRSMNLHTCISCSAVIKPTSLYLFKIVYVGKKQIDD